MPMVGSDLAAALKAAIIASYGAPPTNDAELTNFCNALGTTIVTYIQTNATVNAVVTSGMGAGGTVIGTAPGAVE